MKIALVTGGGGDGSGRAISARFAREGWLTVVCDKDSTAGEKTVEMISAEGGRAEFFKTDVRSREQLAEAFAFAQSKGNVAAVVNNASDLTAYHPEAPLDFWDDIVATDFLGSMWSTRLGIDALRASGGGAIVNVSSTSAIPEHSDGGSPMYDIAKLAVLRLSMRLAFLRTENIRVNCIIPHWIAAPFLVDYVSNLTNDERRARNVPERLIPVDEIAREIYRLATDPELAGEAVIWLHGKEPALWH
ncbi:MAG: SDR family oxidoreductase [Candidatus Eremiobacteraeota bacterium]|nr:SDR family oxidoreductase [Candidatus Eremiobacteraeota bacterium]